MAIKFSAKDQPSAPAVAAKPVKPAAEPKTGEAAEAATDLFKSPLDSPKGNTRKKK
ncbi:hypothetical protein [Mesorhizobium sp. M0488]|uniref:hypothetical protein n=1 Tax=unclassified Mesorhizobium TaxID=325217 RepID=UPI00333AA182